MWIWLFKMKIKQYWYKYIKLKCDFYKLRWNRNLEINLNKIKK